MFISLFIATITEGQFCAIYCEVTGTHTSQGLGIAPTGLKVHFMGMTWARTENGQFQEGRNCFDFLTMYQQLEIVPAT